jgi:cell division protein FtsW
VTATTETKPRPRVQRVGRAIRAARSGPWTGESAAIAVIVLLLVVVGLVMSFSASIVGAAQGGDPFGVFRRQAVWAGIGTGIFVAAAWTDHRVWRLLSWALIAGSVVGLVLVLIPGVGLTEGGSTRWLQLGPLVFQPSEIAKIAVVLWLADVYARKRERGIDLDEQRSHLLIPALPVLAVLALLVLLEPDLGTAVLLAMIVGLVLWIEGIPARIVVALGAAGGVLIAGAAVTADYRFARVTGWLDPTADPLGSGYQLLQSLYALGSGGLFGVGLGQGRGKWNFVPNPETDFIFAVIGEELGLIGAAGVLGLFAALLIVGLRVVRVAPDSFSRTTAFAITGWIVGQALVNVATVTGLLPITGVTLPLVSVGGSSLVVTLAALGILVSISRASGRQLS